MHTYTREVAASAPWPAAEARSPRGSRVVSVSCAVSTSGHGFSTGVEPIRGIKQLSVTGWKEEEFSALGAL